MSINNIYTANFSSKAPFHLQLADGETFYAERIVRVIPKRRLVAFGVWQDKLVVAKIFFDSHRAKRHMEEEILGIKILQENNIPTPSVYYSGSSADKCSFVLLFERIFPAENLEEIWRSKENIEELLPYMRRVVTELATQHVIGVLQRDLHMKNFLLTEKNIYTLDGAQITCFPQMLSKKASMQNIALLLSQLGVGVERYQEELFRHYAKARGWIIKDTDIDELFDLLRICSLERWQRYKKKIYRECSDFALLRQSGAISIYNRHYAAPEFIEFIKDPESAFNHHGVDILKAGRSSTVIKVKLDRRDLVVKRYNIKNPLHYMRRCLRPTRAATSWRLAQKLQLFNVATATPVAFIEKRFLGLCGKSYYVTEYIAGGHIGEFFTRYQAEEDRLTSMIMRVGTLLKNLFKLNIAHGDLKMTNILITSKEQPLLIDLDGAVEHKTLFSLRRAWHKEVKRFLQNFIAQPAIQDKISNALSKK